MDDRKKVFEAIDRERAYQTRKWGSLDEHGHDVGAWITILRRELREAEDAYCTERGDANALREILQVAAVAVACLEEHGVFERKPAPLPAFSSPAPVPTLDQQDRGCFA